ncbi:Adenosine deaminase (Adenosine aminohydrolase) [Durusdinium trenchii]|uniref:Adenosine deaminase n=1 Tax=Durusdinium trenchii TaxID=1381693 RepID=A0ABP0QD78_9DINO
MREMRGAVGHVKRSDARVVWHRPWHVYRCDRKGPPFLHTDRRRIAAPGEGLQKQVFAELLSMELRKKELQARRKARNAAVALERLLEERFGEPDALGTSYQEAATILGDEEAWILIKSDVRREEVFQNVMERLEEKHQNARAEQRTERVVQLQRLMATDPELKRPRTRWKDACAVLARRDELQEEDPPIEALKVWSSMRELRLATVKDPDLKSKVQSQYYHDERKRRDAFVLAMKELAAAERFTVDTSWAQLEEMLQFDQRLQGMREGEGATGMELFDEFIEELKLKGPEAYAGVEPAPPPVVQAQPELKKAPKVELHVHLDGSFDSRVLFRAALQHLEELPEKVRTPWDGKLLDVRQAIQDCGEDLEKFHRLVTVGDDILGLFPILDCFYTFLPIVRGRFDVLEELSYEFCRHRKEENIIYTEVRYSPFEFLVQNELGEVADESLSEQAVEAVCKGLERGQKDFGVLVRQILCCIAAQPSWSQRTVQLAERFARRGVVGVDIASGEMHFEEESMKSFHQSAMALASTARLGVTVHAAESGPGDNVTQAMEVYGATRIGHGYRSLGTEAYEAAKTKGVHFELCPTSSVSTEAIVLEKKDSGPSWATHPIRRFVAERTSCSINSDDPAIFRCSLTDELNICVKEMGMSCEDLQWLTLEALEHAFNLEKDLKESLAAQVKDFYQNR